MTTGQYEYAYKMLRIDYARVHKISEITTGTALQRPPARLIAHSRSKLHALGLLDTVEDLVRADAESERRPYEPYTDDLKEVMEEMERSNSDDAHRAFLEYPGAYAPYEQPQWDELDEDERRTYLKVSRRLTLLNGLAVAQCVRENRIAELKATFGTTMDTGTSALHVHARILLARRPEVSLRQILRAYRDADPDEQELIIRCVDLQIAEEMLRVSALREQLRGFTRARLLAAAGSEDALVRIEEEWASEFDLQALLRAVSALPVERPPFSLVPDLPRGAASQETRARAFEADAAGVRFRARESRIISHIPGSGRASSNIHALLTARRAAETSSMYLRFLDHPADAVLTDLDGTLIDTYDDRYGHALRRLHLLASSGVPVAIVTGRDCENVQGILQSAAAFPGLRIYGRNGADVAESDGSAWRSVEPVVDLAAMQVPERVRVYENLVRDVKTIIAHDAPLLKDPKLRPEFLSLSITTSYRASAHELPPPPEAIDGLIAALDTKLVIPDGFTLWNCGEALQIIPTELRKRACLEHFARTRALNPDRILRVGDQGQAAFPHLVSGNDAEILDHSMGVSVLHAGKSGRRAPHTRGAGLAWILDNASFRLNPPPFIPPNMLETSAFGIKRAAVLETSAFSGYTASGYSMTEQSVEEELEAIFTGSPDVDVANDNQVN